MKKKDLVETRNKDTKALEKKLADLKAEALLSYAKIKSGKEKNTAKVRLIKRDIAQILTIITEKKLTERSAKADENI